MELNFLHQALTEELMARLQPGEATASELNVIRQFLKDNNIDCSEQASDPLKNLAKTLPFEDPDAPIKITG